MIDLGLTRNEQRELRAALRDSGARRVQVTLRDRNEEPRTALTVPLNNNLIEGQVMGDTSQEVSRSLSLGVLDPDRRLRFEGDSPAEGAVYADRFVSVRYGVYVSTLERWIDVPVFWGPITDFSREGDEVRIEAQGKERLMLAPHYALRPYTLKEGVRLDDAIRRVARRTGERRFNLPNMSRKLRNPRTVTARSEPWLVITGGEENARGQKIPGLVEHASGNKFAFYDGRGRLTVRNRQQNPTLTIRPDRDIVGPSGITYDALEAINTVVVLGAEPEGKGKERARAEVSLPKRHPLSPWPGRNGEPQYKTEFVETELRTNRECRERAEQILRRKSHEGIEAELQTLPIPMVEEFDLIRLQTPEWDFTFPLRYWTLPLSPDEPMTLATRRRIDYPRWLRRWYATRDRLMTGGAVIDRKFSGGAA